MVCLKLVLPLVTHAWRQCVGRCEREPIEENIDYRVIFIRTGWYYTSCNLNRVLQRRYIQLIVLDETYLDTIHVNLGS